MVYYWTAAYLFLLVLSNGEMEWLWIMSIPNFPHSWRSANSFWSLLNKLPFLCGSRTICRSFLRDGRLSSCRAAGKRHAKTELPCGLGILSFASGKPGANPSYWGWLMAPIKMVISGMVHYGIHHIGKDSVETFSKWWIDQGFKPSKTC